MDEDDVRVVRLAVEDLPDQSDDWIRTASEGEILRMIVWDWAKSVGEQATARCEHE